MRRGKLLGIGAQVREIDFELVLENVIAEFVAQRLGVGIEVARHYSRLIRPGMHWQWKIVPHHRNLIGLRGLLDQWRRAAAHWALQVLKYNDRNLRPLGR